MPYETSGRVVTEQKEVTDGQVEFSADDWDAAPTKTKVNPVADGVELAEAGPTYFDEPIIVDDFEDTSLSNDYSDAGGMAEGAIVTTDTFEGNNALELTSEVGADGIYSKDGFGLPAYPEKGDVFEWYFKQGANDAQHHGFGFSDFDQYYWVETDNANERFRLVEANSTDGHEGTTLAEETGVSGTAGEYECTEVLWHDGAGQKPDNTIVVRWWALDADGNKDTLIAEIEGESAAYADAVGVIWSDANAAGNASHADLYQITGTVA